MPIDGLILMAVFDFSAPALAAGAVLVAIGVPVLIHLLFKQKPRIVEWAAIRFLPDSKLKQRRRIDHWPLMLARVLALLLPLLAMLTVMPWAESLWQRVRPGVLESTGTGPRTHTTLVVDASLSMTALNGDESRFEAARRLAIETVNAAYPGDGFSLIVLGPTADVRIAGPSNRTDLVIDELKNLTVTHTAGDYAGGLNAVREVLGRSTAGYARRRVLVFSDLQRSGFEGLLPKQETPPVEVWAKVAEKAELTFVDVSGGDVANLSVSNLSLAEPLAFVDAPTIITGSVRNSGRSDKKSVKVELLVARPNGTTTGPFVAVEQKTIDIIPSGGQTAVSFLLEGPSRFRSPGLHVVQLRLIESDSLVVDNERQIALDVRDGLNVLLINGKPTGTALKGASDFLAEALTPGGRASPGNPVRLRTIRYDEFTDATLSDLSQVDCVFLCDLPTITPSQATRLESVLKRGGGVVVGLGPNAVKAKDLYNRVLGPEGLGLLPGHIRSVKATPNAEPGYRLTASDTAWREPPLAVFQDDNARAGLTSVTFRNYARFERDANAPPALLSFAAVGTEVVTEAKLDPAVIALRKHRGRVVVFANTFNRDWSDWPVLPSFLPFVHEVMRYGAANTASDTISVGEMIEETLPAASAGQVVTLSGPGGNPETAVAKGNDSESIVRFTPRLQSGLFKLSLPGGATRPLAVNIAESAEKESDLRCVDAGELPSLHTGIRVVTHPDQVVNTIDDPGATALSPRPHGPMLAHSLTLLAIVAILLELLFAWRFGPARSLLHTTELGPTLTIGQRGFRLAVMFILVAVVLALAIVIHARITGDALRFLPDSIRETVEAFLGVPRSEPGEGVRWHLASSLSLVSSTRADVILRGGLYALLALGTFALYRRERRAVGGWRRLLLPFGLRLAAYAMLIEVVLPQLRLAFEREGFPDVVILIDTSESMSTVDTFHDDAVRKAAAELVANNPGDVTRFRLGQALLNRNNGAMLSTILNEKRCKLHIYSLADAASPVASANDDRERSKLTEGIESLKAAGQASRLGDGVQAVLKAFRGGSLAGVIVLTDGITTAGENLPAAGRAASKAGVPLFLVGIGETQEAFELTLCDLRADDVVAKNDELILEASLTFQGAKSPGAQTVTLFEKRDEGRVLLGTVSVTPNAGGQPTPVRFKHIPTTSGEKTYILEVPALTAEADVANNRLEKNVLVTEGRKLRVLYIEGRPRYEFRFLKVLFERETEGKRGERAIEFKFFLTDAGKDFATTDRSALAAFPTRSELFEYDAVILGDVDPATLPKPTVNLADLAEFVKVKGGGLLLIAGEQAQPAKYFETPLAGVLPVLPAEAAATPSSEQTPLLDGYRPRLSAAARQHALLRLASEDAENERLWLRLQPMFWNAETFLPRQTAEILAVHPTKLVPGTTEPQPLILQQFAGAGRVMFFAFDETWRWRFRQDEELFNRFWRQAVRVLARSRSGRIELRTNKQTPFRRDEPITITARFPDDAPPPVGEVRVNVERSTKGVADRETSSMTLTKVDGSRATYLGTLTRTPEGDYRFRLQPQDLSAKRATTEARVVPPPGEREQLQLNETDLTQAAAESHGHYYTLATAETLTDDLPEVERPPLNQPCPPMPLWNNPLCFATILSLLGLEWVLRKQSRLL
ncbi:hypothetical protein BH11PLA2_BH11PLA2_41460 [soil metagenome]